MLVNTTSELGTVLTFHILNHEKLQNKLNNAAVKVCKYSVWHETKSFNFIVSVSCTGQPPACAFCQIVMRALSAHWTSTNRGYKQNSTQIASMHQTLYSASYKNRIEPSEKKQAHTCHFHTSARLLDLGLT